MTPANHSLVRRRVEKSVIDIARYVISFLLIFLSVGSFQYLISSIGTEDARQFEDERLMYLLSIATRSSVLLGLIILLKARPLLTLFRYRSFCILVSFIYLSVIWSDNPGQTLSSLFKLMSFLLVGLWVAEGKVAETVFDRLVSISRWLLYLNLLAAITIPDSAFMAGLHEGALRGALHHKNGLGLHLALVVSVLSVELSRKKTLFSWFELVLALIMIALTRSATGIAAGLTSCGAALALAFISRFFTTYNKKFTAVTIMLMVCVISGIVTILLLPYIADLFGRDQTLGSRSGLWSIAFEAMKLSPIYGHGFRAFWTSDNQWTRVFEQQGIWYPSHSHNGYIDAALDGGVIELLLLIIFLSSFVKVAAKTFLNSRSSLVLARYPLCLSSLIIVHNISESSFPFDNYATTTYIVGGMALIVRLRTGKNEQASARFVFSD